MPKIDDGRRRRPWSAFCHSATRPSEVESDRARERSRRDVVGAAECREEVIEHVRIGYIHDFEPSAPFVPFTVEEVIVADRNVE